MIRYPASYDRDREFSLKWWRLHVTSENGYPRYEKAGYSGITVTSFSDQEYDDIIGWCRNLALFKIGKINSFSDSIGTDRICGMSNSDGMLSFTYTEREFGIFGYDDDICRLEEYMTSIKQRTLETFVHGLRKNEINRICKGTSYRIVEGIAGHRRADKALAVSTSDSRAYFELHLRSKNGIDIT